MEGTARAPLRDIGVNSPSLKRQKLGTADSHYHNSQPQPHEHVQLVQQQQAMPLTEWQHRWRKIMRESVIYFDSNDPSVLDGGKRKEKEQAIKMFTQVGASIQQFFDHSVTVVVSNRDKSELPPKMFAYSSTLKFWKYDKVFRFLKHLGEVPSPDSSLKSKQLQSLLQDEKLHGTLDRDPSAKRDDFNYFKYPHFYVYDLRQVIKPVALREWKIKDDKRPWPHLYPSTYGHSLFTADPANTHDPKKRERRRLRDEQNKRHRDRLKAIYAKNFNFTSSNENSPNKEESVSPQQRMPPPFAFGGQPPLLSRNASLVTNQFIEYNKRDAFEIEASGYAGSTNASARSAEFTKNGLIAPKSTVPSKQINHLQRKLIEKKSKMSNIEAKDNQKAKVPGYCENCRIHFNDFDEHCESPGHRAFAENDENFESIDELIGLLRTSIRNKR